jgi:hypothetical protein
MELLSQLMCLKEKGIDIKEYDSRIDYRWKEIIRDHPTAEDILNSMKTDHELNEKVTSLAKHAIIHPTWEKVSLEVRRKMYKEYLYYHLYCHLSSHYPIH